ncbi:hypothetical protein Salat_0177000 [Sesamum alatum]|uniref:Uncharacterized protein n=1 Tax=Sesamum alatum TaxID=300844 RepID=A0AAE1YYH6_9LAMI|nr:hypothetical protein Salat_0177000 [Sesamum alatum]
MRDCPKRSKLNALVAEHTDNEREMGSMRVSSMQIGALRVKSRACGNSCKTGLLIVKGLMVGAEIEVVVDTGAMHSLISSRIVQQRGLDIKTWDRRLKAVNSKALPVDDIVLDLCIGPWKGTWGFVAAKLDDFDVILGNDFFISEQVSVHPSLDGIYIARCKHPRLVNGMYGKGKPRAKKKLYDETYSSNIVGFCCIEKMEDEMMKRWDKA